MKAKLVILMILLILFTIFVTENTEEVGVMLFFWPIMLSKIVLLIITLVVGFVLGLITAALSERKHTKIIREKEENEKIRTKLAEQQKINQVGS